MRALAPEVPFLSDADFFRNLFSRALTQHCQRRRLRRTLSPGTQGRGWHGLVSPISLTGHGFTFDGDEGTKSTDGDDVVAAGCGMEVIPEKIGVWISGGQALGARIHISQ
jgi:hypothetical protein